MMMPPEPARPHAGPWRIEHPAHLTAPLLLAADETELYYLERVTANAADDALVAAAPALRAALLKILNHTGTRGAVYAEYQIPAAVLYEAWAVVLAATAPAAPGELP